MPIQFITPSIISSVANTQVTGTITASQLATSLNLATNNVQVASIQSATGTPGITFAANGQVTLANTPLQLTGGQIVFPGTQIASGDANTLDDYEEGTWTAAITTGGIASQSCNYTKIGRMVTITGDIIYNGASVTPDLTGVPFTSANTHDIAVAIYASGMEVSAGGPIIGFLGKNNTKIFFYSWVNNSLGSAFQSSGEIIFTCTYFV